MPRSPKEPTIKFVVSGRGQFPLDMLRYDCCFPASQDDVVTIQRTFNEHLGGEWTVTLRYVREYKPAGPTDARWKSFGWTVGNIDG